MPGGRLVETVAGMCLCWGDALVSAVTSRGTRTGHAPNLEPSLFGVRLPADGFLSALILLTLREGGSTS